MNHFWNKVKKKKYWLRFPAVILAAFVVFTTAYALVLPALTLETEAVETEAGLDLPQQERSEAGAEFSQGGTDKAEEVLPQETEPQDRTDKAEEALPQESEPQDRTDKAEELLLQESETQAASADSGRIPADKTAGRKEQAAAGAARKAAGDVRRETTDLSELIHSLVIKKGDYEVDFEKDGNLLFHDGDEFELQFFFEEIQGELQFQSDSTPMYFNLPDGFSLTNSFSVKKDIIVSVGADNYTVSGNLFEYEPAVTTGSDEEQHPARIKLVLNDKDPNFEHLKASEDVRVDVTVKGSFSKKPGDSIRFGDKKITLVEPHDAAVSKTAVYDKETKQVHYTVVVAADGAVTEPVDVADAVAGAAIHITGPIAVESYLPADGQSGRTPNERTDIMAQINAEGGKGFTSQIPSMQNGETVIYTYFADVDFAQLSNGAGDTSFEEAGNTVTISGMSPDTDYTYNNKATALPEICFTDIQKDVALDGEIVNDGNRVWRYLHWTITVNKEAAATLAGAPIKDYFDEYNTNVPMYYGGEGLTIERWKQSGSSDAEGNPILEKEGEEEVSWRSLGITNIDSDSFRPRFASWTYNVPEDDDPYMYVIHYDTRVDLRKLTAKYDLTNFAEVKNLVDPASIVVEPIGNGDDIDIQKEVVSISNDTVTWNLRVKLRPAGYDSFLVNDLLPNNWIKNEFYTDTLHSYKVISGLTDGERLDEEHVTVTGSRGNYTTLSLPFQKQTGSDEWVSGLKATDTERELVIQVITDNNREWLQLMLDPSAETWQQVHTNRAEVWADNMYDLAVAEASPMPLKLTKQYSKPTDTETRQEYRQTTNVLGDGTPYENTPLYRFHVTVSGVMSDRLTVFDTFDTDLFQLVNVNSLEVAGSDNAWWHQGADPRAYNADDPAKAAEAYHFKTTETAEGFRIDFDVPKRPSDGGYYSYYHLVYYLAPKNLEAMNKILEMAGANPQENTPYGLAIFENTAYIEGVEPKTAEFDFPYQTTGKTGKRNGSRISYELELNSAKARLNGGNTIEAYDTHSSNLSVIYNTVRWETDPADRHDQVTWDMTGNKATFRIPDETYVKIQYDANVIVADGKTEDVWNDLEMLGYTDETNEEKIEHSGGGTAGVYLLNIYKYNDGDMTKPLKGAVFRLLDENRNPMKYPSGYPRTWNAETNMWEVDASREGKEITFSTQENGYVQVTLNADRDGEVIRKNTAYYLEEIKAPDGYKPNFTLYSFLLSDNPDYSAPGGVYVYSNGDIAKIRNRDDDGGFYLVKRLNGNVELTAQQKNGLSFVLEKKNGDDWETVKTISYADLKNDTVHLTKAEFAVFGAGTYRVREEGEQISGLSLVTTYNVDGTEQLAAEFEVLAGEEKSHSVVITNTYFDHSYSFTKTDEETGAVLRGAEFTVYQEDSGQPVGEVRKTEGVRGNFVIRPSDGSNLVTERWYQPGVLYYVQETKAPEGYQMPQQPEKYYFYYTEENASAPTLPEGVTAVDLTTGYGAVTIENKSSTKTSVVASKAWLDETTDDTSAPEDAEVVFTLYCNGQPTGKRVTLNGKQDVESEWEAHPDFGETEPWRAEWTDLDVWTDGVKNVYTIKEETVTGAASYVQSTEEIGSGGVITNKRSSAELRFAKEWYGQKGLSGKAQSWPENTVVRFALTRFLQTEGGQKIADPSFRTEYLMNAQKVLEVKKTPADASGTIARTTGAYSTVYDYRISGLDKTGSLNGTAGTWVYALEETDVLNNGVSVTEAYRRLSITDAAGKQIFQNIPAAETVDLSAKKTWNIDAAHEVAEDERPAAVEFTLYHKIGYMTSTTISEGGAYYEVVTADAAGQPVTNPVKVTAGSDWTAAFSGLAKYTDNDAAKGEEEYLLRETAVYFGGTKAANRNAQVREYYETSGEGVYTGKSLTINNKPATMRIDVTKQWDSRFLSDETRTVEFTLLRDGAVWTGQDGTPVKITLPDASGAWTASVEGLPKYRADGTRIAWSVKETGATLNGTALSEDEIRLEFDVSQIKADGTKEALTGVEATVEDVDLSGSGTDGAGSASGAVTVENAPATGSGAVELTLEKEWLDETGRLIPAAERKLTDYDRDITLYRTAGVPVAANGEKLLYGLNNSTDGFVGIYSTNSRTFFSNDSIWTCRPGETVEVTVPGKKDDNFILLVYYKDGHSVKLADSTIQEGEHAGRFAEDGVKQFTIPVTADMRSIDFEAYWNPTGLPVTIKRAGSQDTRLTGTLTQAQNAYLNEVGFVQLAEGNASAAATKADASKEEVLTFAASDENGWSMTKKLPKYDSAGNLYTYFVKETGAADSTKYVYADGKITVQNVMERKNITVQKEWSDAATVDHTADQVRIDLYRTTEPVTANADGQPLHMRVYNEQRYRSITTDKTYYFQNPSVKSYADLWVYPGDKLSATMKTDSGDQNYAEIRLDPGWKLIETEGLRLNGTTDVLSQYTSSTNQDGSQSWKYQNWTKKNPILVVDFTLPENATEIAEKDLWIRNYEAKELTVINLTHPNAGQADITEAVTQLVAENKAELVQKNIVLTGNSSAENWSHLFENLPQYKSNADGTKEEYHYLAVERPIDGYTAAYTQKADGTLLITNTPPADGTTTFTFHKVWTEAGKITGQLQPWKEDITVELYQDTVAAEHKRGEYTIGKNAAREIAATAKSGTFAITGGSTDNDYYFTISGLPANHAYYVKEAAVSGFTTSYGSLDENGALAVRLDALSAGSGHPYIINQESSGYELPSTGGSGNLLFYIIGAGLVLLAGGLLWRYRAQIFDNFIL